MTVPRAEALGAALVCALVAPGAAHALAAPVSPVAYAVLSDAERPTLRLAQRVITRTWGLSEDSTYVVVSVPDWRSEGGALALSAALPGAGQLYTGQRSGVLFLLAEAAGWAANLILVDTADKRRDDAHHLAGDPRDPSSNWSFERWTEATSEDPAALEQLYAGDPSAFYERIRSPDFAAGFVDDGSREGFSVLQRSADRRRRFARYAAMGLWLNHAVAALDALRAARIHNLPLQRNLELRVRPALGGDGAGFTASIEGAF